VALACGNSCSKNKNTANAENSKSENTKRASINVKTGPVIISEFMAQNSSYLAHENGKFYDWLELYNTSSDTVNLNGFFLTDNREKLTKCSLDSLIILPHKTHLLWAGGNSENPNHVNFKLKKEAGEILLVSSDQITVYSHVIYENQVKDYSMCLVDGTWNYTNLPSPNAQNSDVNLFSGFSEKVQIEIHENNGEIMVTLGQFSAGRTIKYTTDGSSPASAKAKIYSEPFNINKGVMVRALQMGDKLISKSESRATFIEHSRHNIPVVSLITNPENLWNDDIGILVEGNHKNFEKRTDEWIREGNMQFYRDGVSKYAGAIQFKNYGAGTRLRPKKSMTIIAKDHMPNEFFSSTKREELDGFVLRACYSDASRFKNEIVNGVNMVMGSNTAMQEYHPVAFYINGKYWGIYNLSERKNKDFIKAHYGVSPSDIVTSNGPSTEALKGSSKDFIQFIDSINVMTMNEKGVLDYVAENFDLESLFDFWIHEIFTNKSDRFNNKFWRSKKLDNKWRFVSYDFDIGFVWPDNPKTLKIMKKEKAQGINFFGRLMMNREFSTAFLERMCDFLNFGYTESFATKYLKELDSLTRDEFKLDYDRWSTEWKKCLDQGETSKRKIIKFMAPRAAYFREIIAAEFGLKEEVIIQNPTPEKGDIYVNGYLVTAPAVYFKGMKVRLKAVPKDGFKFGEWTSASSSSEEEVTLNTPGVIEVIFN